MTTKGGPIYILIICGAIPIAAWWTVAHGQSIWPDFSTQAYLLTAGLFGILLIGNYPPIGSRWFWKSMIPIVAIHTAVLAALLGITLEAAPLALELPLRTVYGVVAGVLMLEWWISLRIIEAFEPQAR